MNNMFVRLSQMGTQTGNRKMSFVASDATKDSYGTVLLPSGWQLERFNKNPVIFYQHDQFSYNPDAIIGKGYAYVEAEKLMLDVEFEPEGMNDKADKVWKKLEFGTLNAVSVGFIPKEGRWGVGAEGPGKPDETYYYTAMELLEVSVVAVPANPNALKNSAEEEDRLAELRSEALKTVEIHEEVEVEEMETQDDARMQELNMEKTIAIAEAEMLLQMTKSNN